ncbi:MAG: hypothetical protein A3B96_02275 [Candidatus Spechtbacteria bacterium RIFCSPHIGHO2_02_FULL_43_15b]|nr:MAG: hypothetical protein A3B96_02275 [Candidatus Spechtbacteria bacterium RIFCSPHIGHO2_02_FULL_43_15b]
MLKATAFVFFLIMVVIDTIIYGYTLSVLWNWFMVPILNMPSIGIIHAIGIAMVVRYLTYQINSCKAEKKSFVEMFAEQCLNSILLSSLTLLLGWILHMFM